MGQELLDVLISHTFSGITDCFDVEEIWERPRVALRDRGRLKGLLDDCKYKDGQPQTSVFSHLILELPANMVERDRRTSRGGSRKSLATRLVELHRSSFEKFIPQGCVSKPGPWQLHRGGALCLAVSWAGQPGCGCNKSLTCCSQFGLHCMACRKARC